MYRSFIRSGREAVSLPTISVPIGIDLPTRALFLFAVSFKPFSFVDAGRSLASNY